MKINIHRSAERGQADHGWLQTKHSFSFANYHNPKMMNFGTLRVLNEDVVAPGKGFGRHPHDNMEIVTIVLEGALEHKDSSGGHGVMRRGDVQRMSAGSGVLHSEFNHSEDEPVHLLQIWIDTAEQNIEPSYEQRPYKLKRNSVVPIVSNTDDAVRIHQNARFLMTELDAGKFVKHKIMNPGNGMYIFVIDGSVILEKETLNNGDGAGITEASELEINAADRSLVLIMEFPME